MVSRSSFCKHSFPSGLYIPSLHRLSRQSCDWFENRCSLDCPCEQLEKPDLKGVGLLQISIQAFLRLLKFSIHFLLYLLINRLISRPCGSATRQKIADCRSLVRRIWTSLRTSISRAAIANLHYSISTYFDRSCEQPFRWKLFTKIGLSYSNPTYLSYPCEQLARLRLFIQTCLAAKIHSLLRGLASAWLFAPCETLKPLCLKRTFSTSWDRTVSDIAIVDFSCTGIPINTC